MLLLSVLVLLLGLDLYLVLLLGQSRSVSVIIYYLMKKYKLNYKEAYTYIKNIKNDVKPNNAFMNKLSELNWR